jgi:hypothetical protein
MDDEELKELTFTFRMSEEEADAVIRQVIRYHLDVMIDDLKRRKEGKGMAIFDCDKDEDIKKLNKHIKAFKLVLKYWGE